MTYEPVFNDTKADKIAAVKILAACEGKPVRKLTTADFAAMAAKPKRKTGDWPQGTVKSW